MNTFSVNISTSIDCGSSCFFKCPLCGNLSQKIYMENSKVNIGSELDCFHVPVKNVRGRDCSLFNGSEDNSHYASINIWERVDADTLNLSEVVSKKISEGIYLPQFRQNQKTEIYLCKDNTWCWIDEGFKEMGNYFCAAEASADAHLYWRMKQK